MRPDKEIVGRLLIGRHGAPFIHKLDGITPRGFIERIKKKVQMGTSSGGGPSNNGDEFDWLVEDPIYMQARWIDIEIIISAQRRKPRMTSS